MAKLSSMIFTITSGLYL